MRDHNEQIINRIREALMDMDSVEEKTMFGGICFLLNDKLCICVRGDEVMCRVGPDEYLAALEQHGATPMIHGGRSMNGYVFVDGNVFSNHKDFEYWISKSLEYNKIAVSSKKKR
ncbi:TfoX/Sxy family protein [Mucilaginibacter pallidiroseus]|uniref:TfoX/Sxy family protein n=1 Tax=Mucilaginibacter pallidiroseus TaxID=2599295 RepID=A0A563UIE9_9SPHI|nr:TfoX/Sxy family protein [Mucilaginibacter pallidiroseus]TWR31086.1 TfoX/Sxy family protein [Mucilaginibacter pallidiroseus]